ncbi:MAG: aldehyde dehydrogenase family protein, partial [Christensenella sp.]
IISRKHFDRLMGFFTNEEIVIGVKSDPDTLRIEPTVLDNVTYSHNIMQSEIFGPILPIIEYKNIHSVIAEIRNHPKPLALYLFSANSATVKTILNTVPYGGGCINDVVVQLATSRMPFGGVGNSGIGSYHGKASFDTFTHRKSILRKSNMLDLPIRYLPGTPKKFKQLRKFIGKG